MDWTEKQRQVIETRDRNLLVSAAAGSGKTAVLVERILGLISEGKRPLDIDELLVMTFTKAAAAEMRERILAAVEKKLAQDPKNVHLQAQAVLIPYAQITTIDSFCLSLIRDHFNLLDIDPAFRVGDEGELVLLRADVMESMLAEYYEKGDPVFQQFVDTYATGKSDSGIEDYIMQVYTFSQSNPFPSEWFGGCREELMQTEEGRFEDTRWIRYLMKEAKLQIEELAVQMRQAMELCQGPEGPEGYLPSLNQEYLMLRGLLEAEDYGGLNKRLLEAEFGRLPAARSKSIDPVKKAMVTGIRDRIKKAVGNLKEWYGAQTKEEAVRDILGTKEVVLKLLELAEEFSRRFQEKKRDRNIVDFNDLEHYALQILVTRQGGKTVYTEAAEELSRRYAQILVDEYQDSNYVQEMLIQSLSGERFGRPNVFMVGDVKQSIYKFRLARPEIFMEKYETYTTKESLFQKIELHQNFRSRPSVLDSVNDVFYRIMTKNLGNVEYNEEAALYPGASFPEKVKTESGSREAAGPDPSSDRTELLLVDTGKEAMGQMEGEQADYTSKEIEAKVIAARIRALTDRENGFQVWDKEQACCRPAEYGDMVILLRSVSGFGEAFINVLTQEGIPAYAETGTGYFDTVEVETMLAMLSILDNPMQDIPLAAVLRSPVAGLEEEELALMMADYKKLADKGQDRGIYGAFRYWVESGKPESANGAEDAEAGEGAKTQIRRKLEVFDRLWSELRHRSAYLPIHELIYHIYKETGYYDYVSAMPAGETRRANLDMLVEKAIAFEKTSYKGLFRFIRYIHQLRKYETDFGEASALGKYEHMVRIMSIHKSKGLEFPIVFLAGMGKAFNKQEVRGKLIIDPDLGIGTDYLDLELRTKTATLKKNVLKRKLDLDNLGEELRVLYVAMTRAREKLIMTGTDRTLAKKLEKWEELPEKGAIPYTILTTAGSFLDWVLMTRPWKHGHVQLSRIPVEAVVGETAARQIQKAVSREELYSLKDQVYDEKTNQELKQWFQPCYLYAQDINLHAVMSVSEIKRLGQGPDEFQGPEQAAVPDYLRREQPKELEPGEAKIRQSRAAERGTAYHRILELLDFTRLSDEAETKRQIHELTEGRRITERAESLVSPEIVWKFVSSPLGRRMKAAQEAGGCHREQQFVMGIPAREMELADSDELVLIQGIIDAYLEEEDGLVLVDYKTDALRPGQEELLVKRYRVQLDYYQRALEQITGRRVKERMIYSLSLQKEIAVGI